MLSYIGRRIAATLPVMGVVAVVVFALLHLSPGDPGRGHRRRPRDRRPRSRRCARSSASTVRFRCSSRGWLADVLRGDLGVSIYNNQPVATMILQRAEPTLALALCTLIVALAGAIPLGVIAAWKAGTWIDRLIMGFAVLGFSFPVFVIGYGLIYLCRAAARAAAGPGLLALENRLASFVSHMVMPSLALGWVLMALFARMTRTSMLEVLSQDYIRTAHAKGLSQTRVLALHALKNAAVPIVTTVGIGVALLIGGVVVTETRVRDTGDRAARPSTRSCGATIR